MQDQSIESRRYALLVADGFEPSELQRPLQAIRESGAQAVVLTPGGTPVRPWKDGSWGDAVEADDAIEDAVASDFDAVVLPGGVMNPDTLRTNADAVQFIRDLDALGRPLAAVCHGPWLLIEAQTVQDRKVTSWPSLRTDLQNAGATWVDEEVVIDGNLITSRRPSDLDAFCDGLLEAFEPTVAPDAAHQPSTGIPQPRVSP